ncbi:6381_t:CDS:2, partial [Acaulospora morrowiae]
QQYLREARNQRLDQQYLREARNQRLDQQISQNVQNDLRGVYGPNNDQRILRIQNQRRNQLVFSDSQSRIIVNFVNQVEDVLNRLRSINVENIEVLNRTSRTNFLNNLKEGTEVIETLERQSDIVPLLYNTTDRCDSNYRPFLPLRKFEVELVLDYLDYVKEGKAQQTNDYHTITGERPTRITEFFEENAGCFAPPERKSQMIARGDRSSR